jgi:epoxide hydrolase
VGFGIGRKIELMEAFRIDVSDADLADLRDRLSRTRWPNDSPASDWEQGTPLGYLQDLVAYWQQDYDWRGAEAKLNTYDQYLTQVEGQRLHFLHVPSPHPGALPLLLSHGWPGSIVEFLDVIGPLTDPPEAPDAFSLVIPSLPGYGFSGPTDRLGWNPRRIAAAFAELMQQLGYHRYGVQGGDWGSMISCNLADLHPDAVVGLHVNFLTVPPPAGQQAPEHEPARRFSTTGSGYQQIQSTKPLLEPIVSWLGEPGG